jgi:hypothetical protein
MGHDDIVRPHWTLHAVTVDRSWETSSALTKSLNAAGNKQDAIIRKRKLLAVRKIFRCTHCVSKCEKCGVQIRVENRPEVPEFRVPYSFCDSCSEEYIEYIETSRERKMRLYWHNDAWMKVWATWIEHQGAVDSYLKSKEFERVARRIETEPDLIGTRPSVQRQTGAGQLYLNTVYHRRKICLESECRN